MRVCSTDGTPNVSHVQFEELVLAIGPIRDELDGELWYPVNRGIPFANVL